MKPYYEEKGITIPPVMELNLIGDMSGVDVIDALAKESKP